MTDELTPEEVEKITFTEGEESLLKTHLLNGSRTKTIEVLGHSILLRTISVREELEVISLIKEWEDTRGFSKAFKTAVLAASIVTIDGEPLYTPFSTEESSRRSGSSTLSSSTRSTKGSVNSRKTPTNFSRNSPREKTRA